MLRGAARRLERILDSMRREDSGATARDVALVRILTFSACTMVVLACISAVIGVLNGRTGVALWNAGGALALAVLLAMGKYFTRSTRRSETETLAIPC